MGRRIESKNICSAPLREKKLRNSENQKLTKADSRSITTVARQVLPHKQSFSGGEELDALIWIIQEANGEFSYLGHYKTHQMTALRRGVQAHVFKPP